MSWASLPTSAGIGPVMLLLCSRLPKEKPLTAITQVNRTQEYPREEHITHSDSRLVKFPILWERWPERLRPGASLQKVKRSTWKTMKNLLWSSGKLGGRKRGGRWLACLQSGDKILWRAGDQVPGAGIYRQRVPVLEHTLGILEEVLDRHESLHCTANITEISTHQQRENKQGVRDRRCLNNNQILQRRRTDLHCSDSDQRGRQQGERSRRKR